LFSDAHFEPRQQVLIYCEVDDYQTCKESGPDGEVYRTSFSGDYVITDLSGKVVAEREYGSVDDLSQSRREDFYLVFPASLPDLTPGNYRLYLIVQDELSRDQVAQGVPLQFSIAGPASASR
jgi:hypothetical protein